jgi:hypothetical protein
VAGKGYSMNVLNDNSESLHLSGWMCMVCLVSTLAVLFSLVCFIMICFEYVVVGLVIVLV